MTLSATSGSSAKPRTKIFPDCSRESFSGRRSWWAARFGLPTPPKRSTWRALRRTCWNSRASWQEELITLEGDFASANASLMAQVEQFEADMRAALAELEKKHAFERG